VSAEPSDAVVNDFHRREHESWLASLPEAERRIALQKDLVKRRRTEAAVARMQAAEHLKRADFFERELVAAQEALHRMIAEHNNESTPK
jgi:hypothetical protein